MPEGSAKTPAPNLQKLEETYRIVGELRGSKNTRRYVAQRRQDGVDVVVSIATAPAGSENNELSHYAADVQLLTRGHHPVVVDVLEARWLDGGAFAVVTARENGTTLGDLLDHGERLSNPRAAAVLQDVLGALDWARSLGVVHRGVTPDDLFLDEDGSQRVRVALVPTPIPITGVPDACGDARTIGALAYAMLTGKAYVPGKSAPLAELAPDLAMRVTDATEKLIACKTAVPDDDTPDVATVIGIIAAGDVLKQAEVEIAAMKEEYQEQHRVELAKCENRRQEVEQQATEAATALADERADFERRTAEEKAALADERADFERVMNERQGHLAQIRETLEQQASDLERRLAEFDERRAEFEDVVLERQREVSAPRSTPDSAPKPRKDDASPPKKIRSVFAPLDAPARPPAADTRSRRGWLVPVAAVAVIVAVGGALAALRLTHSRSENAIVVGKTAVVPTAPTIGIGAGLKRGGFLSQTAGGTVVSKALGAPVAAPRDSVVPPSTPLDTSAAEAQPRLAPRDTANDVHGFVPMPAPEHEPRPHRYPVPRETGVRDTSLVQTVISDTTAHKTTRVVDPVTGRTTTTVTDSVVMITGTRRDTFLIRPGERRDPAPPRDTLRDSMAKPDTTRIRPAIPPP